MINRYNNDKEFLLLKALRYFVENPYTEIYLREFGRKLKISPNSAQRFLNLFLNQGLINDFRKGNLRFFKANIESPSFRQVKIAFSVKKIEDSGLINLLRKSGATHLILFGSSAEGKDDLNSDLDLVIIAISKKKCEEAIFLAQKNLDSEISYHIFSWDEWVRQAEQNKAFYKDIIYGGINLIGEKPII